MRIIRFFPGIIVFLLLLSACSRPPAPKAHQGVLDLKTWDFSDQSLLALNGEWQFFRNRLIAPGETVNPSGFIMVPRNWNDVEVGGQRLSGQGFGTYRLKILLPEGFREELGLRFGEINCSYKAFLNGDPVAQRGVVGISRQSSQGEWLPQVVTFFPEGDSLDLVIQVSNFQFITGGIVYQLLHLGLADDMRIAKEKRSILEIFLFAALFIMGLYHIGLYFSRPKERAPLFLGLLCLLFALRTLMTGEKTLVTLFFNVPFEIMLTLAHLPNYAGIPLGVLFIHALFPSESSKKWLSVSLIISGILSLLVLLTPGYIYSYTMYANILIQALFSVYITIVFVRAFRRRREGSLLYLSGWIVLGIVILIEQLGILEILPLWELTSFGIFGFLFFQTIMLVVRYSRAFTKVESMSEKLLSLDKLKDDFLARTSHELRTPLAAIINLADAMLGRSSSIQEEKHTLFSIIQSGKRLLRLIDDIMDFSRLKNKQMPLVRRAVDPYSVAGIVVSLMSPFLKNGSVVLENRIPSDLASCWADENRLEQILINLVSNAIKFTEKGSIVIGARELDGVIEFSVTDSGIGIVSERLDAVFNSFEQEEAGANPHRGAGLGLSISRELVELHGGEIFVNSEPGKKTVFHFTVPRYRGQREEEGHDSHFTPPDASGNQFSIPKEVGGQLQIPAGSILIVDDEPINLQVLINFLAGEGYHILTASDGEEALKWIEEREGIDLLILDIMLPRLNGYEVCRLLRKQFSLHELPVLMLTAKTRVEDMIAGFNAGANDFVTKPFDKTEVLSRIKTLINLKRVTDDNQVLKRLYDLKKRIVHLISHELENSLYGIVFSTGQLMKRKRFADSLTEQTVSSIHDRAEEIMTVFDKFMELSRLESGNITLKNELVDFKLLVNEGAAKYFRKVQLKKQKLITHFPENELFLVEGDKLYMSHIVENLISNAVKFSPLGKSIRLEVRGISSAEGEFIELEVRDEGPGFTAADRGNMFKEFQKLSARPTAGELSSGLGLSIVKHLVTLHGGSIQAKSEKGAVFTVSLPRKLV